MKKVLSVLALICVAFILSGCSSNDLTDFDNTIDEQENRHGCYHVEGTVTNKSSQEHKTVKITFVCYDIDGNQLGTISASNKTIFAGNTWKYDAYTCEDFATKVDHCDYYEITHK